MTPAPRRHCDEQRRAKELDDDAGPQRPLLERVLLETDHVATADRVGAPDPLLRLCRTCPAPGLTSPVELRRTQPPAGVSLREQRHELLNPRPAKALECETDRELHFGFAAPG